MERYLENPIFILVAVIAIINAVTFFLYGMDKWMAKTNSFRLSEKTLWFFALIGGSFGALFGMHFFRHKTKKTSFQFVLALILLLQLLFGIFIWYLLNEKILSL